MKSLPFFPDRDLSAVALQLDKEVSTWPKANITMEQVHGTHSQEVFSTTSIASGCDAIFTREKNLTLVVRAADCVPLLFYSEAGIVGAIHAGRRGTVAGITHLTLQKLPDVPTYIWIGPHICEDCYEINHATGQTYDLLEENLHQIHETLAQPQIELDLRCTKENLDLHSYRREGPGKPMNYWGISLV